jgi:hypothetical protein
VINATTGWVIAKLADAHGLTVKMRVESTEELLVTDLGHGRVNCVIAAQTLAGGWIAARYRKDRGESLRVTFPAACGARRSRQRDRRLAHHRRGWLTSLIPRPLGRGSLFEEDRA